MPADMWAESMDTLVSVLADIKPAPWDRLAVLVGNCPAQCQPESVGEIKPEKDAPSGDDSSAPSTKSAKPMNHKEMAAVLAVTKFLRRSRGQYWHRLLPCVLEALKTLPSISWARNCKPTREQFSYALTRALGELAHDCAPPEGHIMSVVAGVLDRVAGKLKAHNDAEADGEDSGPAIACAAGMLQALVDTPWIWGKQRAGRVADALVTVSTEDLAKRGGFMSALAKRRSIGGNSDEEAAQRRRMASRVQSLSMEALNELCLTNDVDKFKSIYSASVANYDKAVAELDELADAGAHRTQATIQALDRARAAVHLMGCCPLSKKLRGDILRKLNQVLEREPLCSSMWEGSGPVAGVEDEVDQEDVVAGDMALLEAAARALGSLAATDHEYAPAVVAALQQFYFSSPLLELEGAGSSLTNELYAAVSQAFSSQLENKAWDAVSTEIFSLASSLYVDANGNAEAEDRQILAVAMLGRVARESRSTKVLDVVIPIVLDRFASQSQKLREEAARALAGVMVLEVTNTMENVMDVLLASIDEDIRAKSSKSSNAGYVATILKDGVSSMPRQTLRVLWSKLRHHFVAFCKSAHSSSSMHGEVRQFLPLIAEILARFSSHDPDMLREPASAKATRYVWYYCVSFGFIHLSKQPAEVADAVESVASHIIPFANRDPHHLMEMIHEVHHDVLMGKNSGGARSTLTSLIPSYCAEFTHKLDAAHAFALLSIYYLETIRSNRNPGNVLQSMFEYAVDGGLTADPTVFQCVIGISDRVFEYFKLVVDSLPRNQVRDDILVDAMLHMLRRMTSRSENARTLAFKYAKLLLVSYSSLLFEANSINSALNTLEAVSDAIHADSRVNIEDITTLRLPDTSADRQSIVDELSQLLTFWIKSAAEIAPTTLHAIIHMNYLNTVDRLSLGNLHRVGLSVANGALLQVAGAGGEDTKRKDKGKDRKDNTLISTFLGGLELKARYVGEVAGMRQLLEMDQGSMLAKGESWRAKVYRSLMQRWENAQRDKKLSTILATKDNESHRDEEASFNRILFSLAAVIVSGGEDEALPPGIIQSLVWLPVRHWIPGTLQAATFAWNWIITTRPELRVKIMAEVSAAWDWTMNEKLGLFDTAATNVDCEFSVRTGTPHRVWVKFLMERFEVAKHLAPENVEMIAFITMKSLQDPLALSNITQCRNERFSLMLLGFRMMEEKHFSTWNAVQLMSGRIARAALYTFRGQAAWYEATEMGALGEDIKLFETFAAKITSDTTHWWTRLLSQRPRMQLDHPLDRKKIASAKLFSSDKDRKKANQNKNKKNKNMLGMGDMTYMRKERRLKRMLGNPYRVLRGNRTHLNNAAQQQVDDDEEEEILQEHFSQSSKPLRTLPHDPVASEINHSNKIVRDLILAFLRSEAAMMIAWYNPRAKKAKASGEGIPIARFSRSHWQKMMDAAFQLEPSLAVQMGVRFQWLAEHLEALVLREPEKFLAIPEALPFFATHKNVLNSIPELAYLEHWCDCTLPMALKLLGKEFSTTPVITRYAVRVLRDIDPEVMIFWLPQLVQSLRVDPYGYIEEALAEMSTHSEHLAHQLVWILQTEGDSEGLSEKVVRLRKTIISRFDSSDLERFHAEFSFVSAITAISGKLKPLAKDERWNSHLLLANELQKIPHSQHLYMPTSPDLKIVDINRNNATPMKSAEKCPIMVHFKVQDTNGKKMGGSVFSQACIFKMGDDCRQDQLALQIIDFFKKTFDGAGLGLFLLPYRVLTTGPTCGIIEVVPGSVSRDMLGKGTDGNLYNHFLKEYGDPDSSEFIRARRNFISSAAGYAVISYILQIKDRHNGNILIDKDGHLVHIDFGFIFSISPGGGLRFERSPFRLCNEHIDIMGGVDSEHFKLFVDLTIRGYLAARKEMDSILAIVSLMLHSGLDCFKPNTMEELAERFMPGKTEKEAADHMLGVIKYAHGFVGHWTTVLYDEFQHFSNNIEYST